MDMVAFLRYVFDHNQQVIAGLVVVILVTAILLFLRAIGQEKPATSSASGGASNLDIGAIEAALKKVMAAQSGSTANSSAGAQSSKMTSRISQNSKRKTPNCEVNLSS